MTDKVCDELARYFLCIRVLVQKADSSAAVHQHETRWGWRHWCRLQWQWYCGERQEQTCQRLLTQPRITCHQAPRWRRRDDDDGGSISMKTSRNVQPSGIITSCMNFLQTGRMSLDRVAENIITCFECGVARKISWMSRRMSAHDTTANDCNNGTLSETICLRLITSGSWVFWRTHQKCQTVAELETYCSEGTAFKVFEMFILLPSVSIKMCPSTFRF